MHQAALALHFFTQTLKARMAYRYDFLMQCFSALAANATGLIVVSVIFQKTETLGDWKKAEVIFIYGLAMLSQALFGLVSTTFWQFPNRYVMNGEMDRLLIRPVNPLLQLMMENLEFEELPSLILGLLLIGFSASSLGLAWSPAKVLILSLDAVSAALMLVGVFLALTTLSFWFEDRVAITPPVFNLLAFGRYPLTIFHRSVQMLLSTVIPFGFLAFYPATFFLTSNSRSAEFSLFAWMTPLVGVGSFAVGCAVWSIGVRAYRSTGS